MTRRQYTQNFQKILKWCRERRCEIVKGKEYMFQSHQDRNFIYTPMRSDYKSAIMFILHECGHLVVERDERYSQKFPFYHKGEQDLRSKNTKLYKMDILREETKAWETA